MTVKPNKRKLTHMVVWKALPAQADQQDNRWREMYRRIQSCEVAV